MAEVARFASAKFTIGHGLRPVAARNKFIAHPALEACGIGSFANRAFHYGGAAFGCLHFEILREVAGLEVAIEVFPGSRCVWAREFGKVKPRLERLDWMRWRRMGWARDKHETHRQHGDKFFRTNLPFLSQTKLFPYPDE